MLFPSPVSLMMATAYAMQMQALTLMACMVPPSSFLWPYSLYA